MADLIAAVLIAEVPAAVVVLVCRMPAACRPVAAQVPDGRVLVPEPTAAGL